MISIELRAFFGEGNVLGYAHYYHYHHHYYYYYYYYYYHY